MFFRSDPHLNAVECKENEKSNISFDTSYSNSWTILTEMSEMHHIIEIESYARVSRRHVEAVEKARVFTKDNHQNKLEDSSVGFTKTWNNVKSNIYDQTNARTSGNINFTD